MMYVVVPVRILIGPTTVVLGTGDHRRRLRGAGHLVIVCPIVKLRVIERDLHIVPHKSQHVATRGNDVRFDKAFVGGSGRREGGQYIIGAILRGIVIAHGIYGDDVGHIAGYADALRVGARITSR